MVPVRWLTSRSRTRCRACRSSWSAVFVATNFIVGRCTASAIASVSRKVVLLALGIAAHVPRRHQPRIVAQRLKLATKVMRTDAGLHADKTRWHVGKPCLHLAARPLLAKHNGSTLRVHKALTMEQVPPFLS